MTAGEHGDGAGRERGAVAGGIDAAREARHDSEARQPEVAGENAGHAQARRRGIARADDGDRGLEQDRPVVAHGEKRR